ncbi:hypothetical protein GCM10010191_71090 [Actinomadura vinacea]|uniref:Uncharacterized protein n=1 Tax=Actinomadura vinacea TaxID=115336 RepID=A0ABN3JYP9_9ACTN
MLRDGDDGLRISWERASPWNPSTERALAGKGEDGVLVVALNRPEVRDALASAVAVSIIATTTTSRRWRRGGLHSTSRRLALVVLRQKSPVLTSGSSQLSV